MATTAGAATAGRCAAPSPAPVDIARARGMMQLAKDTGLTREGLYKSLSEQGNPSLSAVMKVMHALGLQMSIGPLSSAG